MQGTPAWYTPPSSALHHEPNSSNYFYCNQWSRPPGNYDTRSYQQPVGPMRSGNDGFGAAQAPAYDCHQMFYRGEYEDQRVRGERARAAPDSAQQQQQQPPGYSKPRTSNQRPNETESENFSYVFTQSLTSLYSNDGESNFTEDSDRAGATIPCAKIKTEDISNDCTQEYNYGTSFEQQAPSTSVLNFENVKIKTEPYSRDNVPSYGNYPMATNMFMRRRRGTLAEAYSRKRKHATAAGAFTKPATSSASEDKSPRVFQPESQWIPNSISTCEQAGVSTYQQPEFEEKAPGFEGGRFAKRHPMKSRAGRGRSDQADVKPATSGKKIQKKISPLTVYAKIVDDRIVDVTCRRYKKRSKPKATVEEKVEEPVTPIESPTQTPNDGPNEGETVSQKVIWGHIFEAVNEVIKELVEQVCEKHERDRRNRDALSSLSPQKAQELIFKFCRDYNMDYRDFINVEEIIRFDVTKQDSPRKKRGDRSISSTEEQPKKRRGMSSEKEESVDRKVEKPKEKVEKPKEKIEKAKEKIEKPKEKIEKPKEKIEKPKEKDPEPDPPNEVVEEKPEKPKAKPEKEKPKPKPKPKALRSTRQREQDSSPPPARVLRSLPSRQPQPPPRKTRSARKPLVRSRYPKRNLRSKKNGPGTRGGKKLKILIDLCKENEQTEEVLEVDSDASSHGPTFGGDTNFSRKSDTESEDEEEKVTKEKPTPEPRETVITPDDESTSVTIVDQMTNSDSMNASEGIKKEVEAGCEEDEDLCSSQPPQLVRMTDEDGEKPEDKDHQSAEEASEPPPAGKLSPAPSESKDYEPASDNPPPTLQPNDSLDQSEPAADRTRDDPPASTSGACLLKNIFRLRNGPSYKTDLQTQGAAETATCESNSEDDCIVVDHKNVVEPSPEQAKPDPTPRSLLKEKLLGKSAPETRDSSASGESKNAFLPPSAKSYGKEEHDESILRTLLLESDGVPNSGIGKDRESSRNSSPFIPGVSGLNFMNQDAMKMLERDGFNSMCSFYNESIADNKQLSQILQYPVSYHEAYFGQLSPEGCDQYNCSGDQSSRSKDKEDSKNGVFLKKSVELHKIIQKLKEEISYLCDLVSQKDKEKLAILCFVRQKEQLVEHFKKMSIRMLRNEYPTYLPLKKEITSDDQPNDTATTSSIGTVGQSLSITRNTNSYSMYDPSTSIISNSFMDSAHGSSLNHRSQSIHTPQKVPAVKPSSVATPPEKVSTVATMVAKASENYGLDMTNLRERLRCSPEASSSGNLLQKALSSQSPNSTPGSPFGTPPWSLDKNSNVRNSIAMAKTGAHMMAKSYQYNIPLDIMMNPTSRVSPSVDIRPTQIPDAHRHNIAVPTPIRSLGDQSQMDTLLAEPVQMKTHCNSYRSCSMQSGGRYGESFARPVPRMMPSLGLAPPVSSPSGGESDSERQAKAPGLGMLPMRPSYFVGNPRSLLQPKASARGSANGCRARKPEESGCPSNYGANPAAASAGPTGSQTGSSSPSAVPAAVSDFSADNVTLPHCMNCGVIRPRFVCSGCRQHMYCSTRCQSARWPDHSSDCNASVERPEVTTSYS